MRNTKARGIRWDDQPLGREPDRALARRLGVVPAAVYTARRRRAIPVFDSVEARARGAEDAPPVPSSLDEWISAAGEEPGPWGAWPGQARAEVAEVIRRNDSMPFGHKVVPARAMVARLVSLWGLASATEENLDKFCVKILGRQGGWQGWQTR